jgi:hypothetical protein
LALVIWPKLVLSIFRLGAPDGLVEQVGRVGAEDHHDVALVIQDNRFRELQVQGEASQAAEISSG